MTEIKLSKRLAAVAAEIPAGARIADIGSDHARLPCYAVLAGIASAAVAVEIVDGPYQAARRQVERCRLEGKISVRKGDGFAAIEPHEVDVAVICGMGGALIRDILERGKEKLGGVTRLILQSNIASHHIRQWFWDNGWELVKEIILQEGVEMYEILVGERGDPRRPYTEPSRADIFLGPFLRKEKNEAFLEKWRREYRALMKIKEQIGQTAETPESIAKRKDILEKLEFIQAVLRL